MFARYPGRSSSSSGAIKEVGWVGFSVNDALTPLVNMGQQLFEPPDVNGWELGRGWFSTGGTLARTNFGATLTTNQEVQPAGQCARSQCEPPGAAVVGARTPDAEPVRAGAVQRAARTSAGRPDADGPVPTRSCSSRRRALVHLIVGSSEYQFV